MATFVSQYLYDLNLTGAGYRAGSRTDFEYAATGTFSSGQTISVNDGSMTYYGYYQNGWVGISNGHYYLLSNDPGLASQIITIQTGDFTTCFLAGTHLSTPDGPRRVEELRIGELVLTADGRAAAVHWIGVQTIVSVFADPLRSFPSASPPVRSARTCRGATSASRPTTPSSSTACWCRPVRW